MQASSGPGQTDAASSPTALFTPISPTLRRINALKKYIL